MFELLGNETEHEAAVKRTINLQQEIMANLERICNCYLEIKSLEEENESLNRALEHWKGEVAKHYSCTNLIADLSGATLATKEVNKTKKKPTTK